MYVCVRVTITNRKKHLHIQYFSLGHFGLGNSCAYCKLTQQMKRTCLFSTSHLHVAKEKKKKTNKNCAPSVAMICWRCLVWCGLQNATLVNPGDLWPVVQQHFLYCLHLMINPKRSIGVEGSHPHLLPLLAFDFLVW